MYHLSACIISVHTDMLVHNNILIFMHDYNYVQVRMTVIDIHTNIFIHICMNV